MRPVAGQRARTWSRNWAPSISGMRMSEITISAASASSISRPAAPHRQRGPDSPCRETAGAAPSGSWPHRPDAREQAGRGLLRAVPCSGMTAGPSLHSCDARGRSPIDGRSTTDRPTRKVVPLPTSLLTSSGPIVFLDDAVGNRQPQAGPLAHRLGGEERIENPRQEVLRGMPLPVSAISIHTLSPPLPVRIVILPRSSPWPGPR